MDNRYVMAVLRTRARLLPLILRVGAGAVFVAYSLGKFRRHDAEAAAFDRYGIPFPDLTTYLVGTLELVGGILLVTGLLTRPVAVALLGNMVGALTTAGRIEPSFSHTVLPPLLIAAMLVLLWTGAGARSVDRAICRRLSAADVRNAPSALPQT